ncbi:MAG: HAD family hydrolase [Thermoplasmata archaeon]|nr:HAD family hydrolase [Thermoplasmata archaeon]
MAIDAVLFDLDDTLYDHRHARLAGLQAIRRVEPALGRLPLARLDRTFERLLSEIHISRVLTGRISLKKSRWLRMTQLLHEYQITLPRSRIQELIDIRVEEYVRHRRAVPGAPALLRHLHTSGKTVVVVTNNLRSEQAEKLRVIRLEGLVDHLVCSEQVGVTKPDPHIFQVALHRADAQARTSVMVGDSWEFDVVGAVEAGIRAVWFHRDGAPLPMFPTVGELRSFRPLNRASAVILGRSGPDP